MWVNHWVYTDCSSALKQIHWGLVVMYQKIENSFNPGKINPGCKFGVKLFELVKKHDTHPMTSKWCV